MDFKATALPEAPLLSCGPDELYAGLQGAWERFITDGRLDRGYGVRRDILESWRRDAGAMPAAARAWRRRGPARQGISRPRMRRQRARRAHPPEVEAALRAYAWPGNVRELQNLCARWAEACTGALVRLDDLPPEMRGTAAGTAEAPVGASYGRSLRAMEDQMILAALEECRNNISAAARRLGVSRTTLYQKLHRISRSSS